MWNFADCHCVLRQLCFYHWCPTSICNMNGRYYIYNYQYLSHLLAILTLHPLCWYHFIIIPIICVEPQCLLAFIPNEFHHILCHIHNPIPSYSAFVLFFFFREAEIPNNQQGGYLYWMLEVGIRKQSEVIVGLKMIVTNQHFVLWCGGGKWYHTVILGGGYVHWYSTGQIFWNYHFKTRN